MTMCIKSRIESLESRAERLTDPSTGLPYDLSAMPESLLLKLKDLQARLRNGGDTGAEADLAALAPELEPFRKSESGEK